MKDKILWINLGLLLGLCFVCLIGANYRNMPNGNIYTSPLDFNDPIYRTMPDNINAWYAKFGECERTLVLFNLSQNNQRTTSIEKFIANKEKIVNDINEPAKADNSKDMKNQDNPRAPKG